MKKKVVIIETLIIVIMILSSYSFVFAEDVHESESCLVNLANNQNRIELSSQRWLDEPMWYCKSNTYSPTSHDYKYCEYNTAAIANLPRYKIHCQDLQGSKELAQVDNLKSPDNDQANGAITISVSIDYNNYPNKIYVNNDEYQMQYLNNDIKISTSTTVGTGKLLYRTGARIQDAPWGSWNYINLPTSNTISIGADKAIQMVIIYEVKEEAPNWTKPHKYYRCFGVYRINTLPQ